MAEPEIKRKRKSRFFPGLLFGLVLGWLGASLAPSSWQAFIPDAIRPGGLVDGEVLEKSRENDRLLLKLTTERGMILATFHERQEEIDLLIEKGDTVTIRVERYQPFLEDPPIERVGRPDVTAPAPMTREPEREPEAEPAPEPMPEPGPEPQPETEQTEPESTTTVPS